MSSDVRKLALAAGPIWGHIWGHLLTLESDMNAGGNPKDEQLLKNIADYNQVDCVSTLQLREWLVRLRPPELAWYDHAEAKAQDSERVAELTCRSILVPAETLGRWLLGA